MLIVCQFYLVVACRTRQATVFRGDGQCRRPECRSFRRPLPPCCRAGLRAGRFPVPSLFTPATPDNISPGVRGDIERMRHKAIRCFLHAADLDWQKDYQPDILTLIGARMDRCRHDGIHPFQREAVDALQGATEAKTYTFLVRPHQHGRTNRYVAVKRNVFQSRFHKPSSDVPLNRGCSPAHGDVPSTLTIALNRPYGPYSRRWRLSRLFPP